MSTEKELLKGNTPTLVLAVLNDAPLHGYGIAREIERRSDNALQCKEGTLYPALHRLEREGLIAGRWEHTTERGERKVYTITPAGRSELSRRIDTWKTFAEAIGRALEETKDAGAPRREPGRAPDGLSPEPA